MRHHVQCTATSHFSESAYEKILDAARQQLQEASQNIFSLQSFGLLLRDPASTSTSSTAHTANLTADGRRADVQIIELQPPERTSGPPVSGPPIDLNNDDNDWLYLPGPNIADSVYTSSTTQDSARKRKWYATTVGSLLSCLLTMLMF